MPETAIRKTSEQGVSTPLSVDISVLETLATFLEKHDLTDVEIEDHGIRAIIRRQPTALSTQVTPVAVATATASAVSTATSQSSAPNTTTVTAPLLGMVYGQRSPEAPPFVTAGQQVSKGEVLCLIEAMKLFNEITAPKDGTVLEIHYKEGTMVEYGAPLFTLG